MRGLTTDERAELNDHLRGAEREMDNDEEFDAHLALVSDLARQRRLIVNREVADDQGGLDLETTLTKLGRLALRVCPP